MQHRLDIHTDPLPMEASRASTPHGYKGLYGFHKYWGKKPSEPLAFIVEQLSSEGDIVLDPFVGSGVIARESLTRHRRFIGFDLNPLATELTKLMVSPPHHQDIIHAFQTIRNAVKDRIDETYRLADGRPASHYLWNIHDLLQVWAREPNQSKHNRLVPCCHDYELSKAYESYRSTKIKQPKFFSNSRINADQHLTLSSLLSGRAQHNLDLILSAIDSLPRQLQSPIKLCTTAASGQMTKMVFAISNRNASQKSQPTKIEVGSWVIGYWRPKLHFEINVWNCFERRVLLLLKALTAGSDVERYLTCSSMEQFWQTHAPCYVECAPCQSVLPSICDESVKLVLTDPPHNDRIPYLELSELWNSILGLKSNFDDEIVVSDSNERGKTRQEYNRMLSDILVQISRILRKDGFLVLFYSSREASQWSFLRHAIHETTNLRYLGKFPCHYSARSVVQDTRRGSLKDDMALVFGKPAADSNKIVALSALSGWDTESIL